MHFISILAALLLACTLVPVDVSGDTPSDVIIKPDPVKFPGVRYSQCRSKKVTVINKSDSMDFAPAHMIEESEAFALQRNKCPDTLKPGKSCKLWINFCPPAYDTTYETNLVFPELGMAVPVSGEGLIAP